MIENYSSNPHHFNRTLLHRSYCVSSRCSSTSSNATQRFLSCVREYEKDLGMEISLQSHHCDRGKTAAGTTYNDKVFIWVFLLLLALNMLGTLYDVVTEGENKLLLAWSIRSNWQEITFAREVVSSQRMKLAPIQGLRMIMMILVIIVHAFITSHHMFISNPDYIEKLEYQPSMIFAKNGAPIVQTFVVLSTFFMAYSILSKNKDLSYGSLPKNTLRRMARILPVHLVVVGFAATWWRYTGDGPLWPNLVLQESDVCRRKFLWHALFLHNLVDNDNHCLVQTWFLAVDFQLHIVASLILITLSKITWRPVPTLSAMCLLACLVNGILIYYNQWESFLAIILPKNNRVTFTNSASFRDYYQTPWGSLPACLMGLILAHVYNHLRKHNINLNNNRVFTWLYHVMLPLVVAWAVADAVHFGRSSVLTTNAYIERPVYAFLSCVLILGIIINAESMVSRLLAWRGWHLLASLNLSVLVLHWCVNKTLVANRRSLMEFSIRKSAMEICATVFFSYVLALPLTLLVEWPVMRTISLLV
ncbi:O-acyltransferase like protein-like isoform X2 [Aricia agestis]|uniref:O-acyltransferase like protein-like isoform X1 n=1 Tax=Aricia agestis TaxID=91739 RepID=UPI001C20B997|nr:O-acyltransferase like protein-like isoform X1 [Aricia agestis]XP_041971569.1 O-acyltransferase like protein-like isoform X2 [Aricia agestis]